MSMVKNILIPQMSNVNFINKHWIKLNLCVKNGNWRKIVRFHYNLSPVWSGQGFHTFNFWRQCFGPEHQLLSTHRGLSFCCYILTFITTWVKINIFWQFLNERRVLYAFFRLEIKFECFISVSFNMLSLTAWKLLQYYSLFSLCLTIYLEKLAFNCHINLQNW